jgi:hypothetical protein
VHEAQRVEVAVAKEDHAGGESPDESDDGEERIGKVSEGEESTGRDNRAALAGEDAKQAEQNEALQEKLLHERPDGIAPECLDEMSGAVRQVQRVESQGEGDGDRCDEERWAEDPE